ncbi:MAG TPA: nickel pincer cofactor biosynthesis protein LarC [Bryobacteraceae bacterium]
MKICYFDAFSGISGDMSVGALIDAGASWDTVRAGLESLNLDTAYRLEKVKRQGIAASKFYVDGVAQKAHRHLPHIEKIINSAAITQAAKDKAVRIFRRLGEAEAKSHNVPIEKVHFHEVGAADSISDIVGACIALDSLAVSRVYSSTINVGSGTVVTEHGVLPVPAPATTELLKGAPIYAAGPEVELTTPTGAAILATLAEGFGPMPPLQIESQGFGAGDKEFLTQANVLRVVIGEASGAAESTTVSMIEANIDDSTAEVLGFAMERLLGTGALDVTFEPVFMKKNRPGTKISVMAAPDKVDALVAVLFRETSTLGVRIYRAERRVQARAIREIQTSFGMVRVKEAENGWVSPEYDDCRRLALEKNVALRTVIAEVNSSILKGQ